MNLFCLCFIAVLAGGARVPCAAAAVPCPASEMSISGGVPFTSSAATLDSSAFFGDIGGHRVAYDHPAGTVNVYHCCGLGRTYVKARDAFDVTGVPPGIGVGLVVELIVDGAILSAGCSASGCWGTLGFSLASGPTFYEGYLTRQMYAPGREEVHGGLLLPVTIVSGQPVTIEYQLWAQRAAGGNHGAEGSGRLRFTGLPEGARVVSCQGFDSAPVPARRSSWGRIRTLYR